VTIPVGRVLGTQDAMPLEFWVAVEEGQYVQLDDVVEVAGEQLFESDAGRRVVHPPSPLEHAGIDDVLSQCVLEAVHRLGLFGTRENEVEPVELAEMSGHVIRADVEDARDQ